MQAPNVNRCSDLDSSIESHFKVDKLCFFRSREYTIWITVCHAGDGECVGVVLASVFESPCMHEIIGNPYDPHSCKIIPYPDEQNYMHNLFALFVCSLQPKSFGSFFWKLRTIPSDCLNRL